MATDLLMQAGLQSGTTNVFDLFLGLYQLSEHLNNRDGRGYSVTVSAIMIEA